MSRSTLFFATNFGADSIVSNPSSSSASTSSASVGSASSSPNFCLDAEKKSNQSPAKAHFDSHLVLFPLEHPIRLLSDAAQPIKNEKDNFNSFVFAEPSSIDKEAGFKAQVEMCIQYSAEAAEDLFYKESLPVKTDNGLFYYLDQLNLLLNRAFELAEIENQRLFQAIRLVKKLHEHTSNSWVRGLANYYLFRIYLESDPDEVQYQATPAKISLEQVIEELDIAYYPFLAAGNIIPWEKHPSENHLTTQRKKLLLHAPLYYPAAAMDALAQFHQALNKDDILIAAIQITRMFGLNEIKRAAHCFSLLQEHPTFKKNRDNDPTAYSFFHFLYLQGLAHGLDIIDFSTTQGTPDLVKFASIQKDRDLYFKLVLDVEKFDELFARYLPDLTPQVKKLFEMCEGFLKTFYEREVYQFTPKPRTRKPQRIRYITPTLNGLQRLEQEEKKSVDQRNMFFDERSLDIIKDEDERLMVGETNLLAKETRVKGYSYSKLLLVVTLVLSKENLKRYENHPEYFIFLGRWASYFITSLVLWRSPSEDLHAKEITLRYEQIRSECKRSEEDHLRWYSKPGRAFPGTIAENTPSSRAMISEERHLATTESNLDQKYLDARGTPSVFDFNKYGKALSYKFIKENPVALFIIVLKCYPIENRLWFLETFGYVNIIPLIKQSSLLLNEIDASLFYTEKRIVFTKMLIPLIPKTDPLYLEVCTKLLKNTSPAERVKFLTEHTVAKDVKAIDQLCELPPSSADSQASTPCRTSIAPGSTN